MATEALLIIFHGHSDLTLGIVTNRHTADLEVLQGEFHPRRSLEGSERRGDGAVSLGGLAAPIVLSGDYWLVLATWPTNVDVPNAFAEIPPTERPPIAWESSLDLFEEEFERDLDTIGLPGHPAPARALGE